MNWDTEDMIMLIKNALEEDLLEIEISLSKPLGMYSDEILITVSNSVDIPRLRLSGKSSLLHIETPANCQCDELILHDSNDGIYITESDDFNCTSFYEKVRDVLIEKYSASVSFEGGKFIFRSTPGNTN